MLLVSIIKTPKLSFSLFFLLISVYTTAQENSPFSRFGLGNILPARNVVNSAMGGTSATYSDQQTVNFSNPASYSALKTYVVYDIGVSLTSRSLKSVTPANKYGSIDLLPSYVMLGMPIGKKRPPAHPLSQKRSAGLVIGLRPLSRISYSTQEAKRITGIGGSDSLLYLYEGSGGLYQAMAGVGKQWGDLSVGINTGYSFGRRENNTRTFIVDSVDNYNSNSSTVTSFGNFFISGGLQYKANVSRNTVLRLGVSGNMKHKLNAKQDVLRETFVYQTSGDTRPIDTAAFARDKAGTINLPVSYTAGFSINNVVLDRLGNKFDKGSIAVEYESSKWSDFRFYNQTENLMNSWQLKIGGQLVPDPLSVKSYWNHVAFRGGFYFGKDAMSAGGKQLSVSGISLGTGLPVRKWRSYDNQFTNINTSFEFGRRGNKENNISESFFRFSVGLSLSDIWFIKRRYD